MTVPAVIQLGKSPGMFPPAFTKKKSQSLYVSSGAGLSRTWGVLHLMKRSASCEAPRTGRNTGEPLVYHLLSHVLRRSQIFIPGEELGRLVGAVNICRKVVLATVLITCVPGQSVEFLPEGRRVTHRRDAVTD